MLRTLSKFLDRQQLLVQDNFLLNDLEYLIALSKLMRGLACLPLYSSPDVRENLRVKTGGQVGGYRPCEECGQVMSAWFFLPSR